MIQSCFPPQVEDFLRMSQHSSDFGGAVVLLAGPREASEVAEHLRRRGVTTTMHGDAAAASPTWLVGSLGLDLARVESIWSGVFHGGVFVQPRAPELRYYVNKKLQTSEYVI